MKAFYFLAFAVFISCNMVKGTQADAQTDSNTINFLVLNISTEPGNSIPSVKLVSKTAGAGTLKKRKDNSEAFTGNYLTLYLYHQRQLTDSVRVDHPLYKHYEYPDDENKLTAKDTVIGKADFIVRFQTEAPTTEIRITETRANTPSRQLSIIKL